MKARSGDVTNRSKLARSKRRELDRAGWIQSIVAESKQLAETLHGCSLSELRNHTNRLAYHVRTDETCDDRRILILAAAGMIEAVRRTLGVHLFEVQLHAGVIVSHGAVAEMQTGEGKTFSVALPAYVRALAGRGVHVATPNNYLAQRDHEKLSPVYNALGMTAGLLVEQATPGETRAAYQADITYGPGHAFGFDYLRDQLALGRSDDRELGSRVLEELSGERSHSELLQRGLHAAIVDEIDHVLIDDAVSPLLLSGGSEGESPDAEVHRKAGEVAHQLVPLTDFQIPASGRVELTDIGFERVYAHHDMTIHLHLVRPWHEYVVVALRANLQLQRDVNYVVRGEQVQLVDESTGRIYPDRSWSDGLHQAVEAKEGLTISCENAPLARITRQRFFRYYQSLGGMTGTATGCEYEFAAVYGIPVAVVPLRMASQRAVLAHRLTASHQEKWHAIAEEAQVLSRRGRAVLIGTLSIAESMEIAELLAARGLAFQLLNGIQDADEAAVIRAAGQPGAITVATNLAGRGTDIALAPEVAAQGGLHVIVSAKHSLERIDRQLVGRCARCGDPGTARFFLSPTDSLLQEHAPWIGRAMLRWDGNGRRGKLKIARHLKRIQVAQQRFATSQRWQLLQSDRENEKILSKPNLAPDGCWQM